MADSPVLQQMPCQQTVLLSEVQKMRLEATCGTYRHCLPMNTMLGALPL